MTWSVFPLAIARSAGYDYAMLARLADPELLTHAREHARTGAEEGWPARYASACAAARRELAALLEDPAVREGIAVLAGDVLRWTAPKVRAERDGGPDKYERKLSLFLQRLAAKCDTNAVAGTIGYIALDPSLSHLLPDGPRRHGFVAHWVLSELLLQRALERYREVRPEPGPALALLEPEVAHRMTDWVAGAQRWADLRRNGKPVSAETVRGLHRRGVLLTAPVLPVAEPDALYAARAADGDGRHAADLETLSEAARAYAAGGAAEKLEVLDRTERWLTAEGLPSVRRGAGEVYRDRTVLYAEHYEPPATDDWRIDEAGDGREQWVLDTVAPVLDLAAATGVWAREEARAQALVDVAALAGDRQRVPLREVLSHLPGGYPVSIEQAAPVSALLQQVTERGAGSAREVRLSPQEVRHACDGWLVDAGQPLLASPDVFLCPPEGAADRGTVVLGEVHAGLTVFGNLLCFLDDHSSLLETARTWLADADPYASRLVNLAMGQRYGKVCHLEVMPRTLELGGRAVAQGRKRLSAADVEVDRQLRIWLGEERVELPLASGDGTLFSPFAPPAARHPLLRHPGAAWMPRVLVGDCVLQRETWWVPAAELADAAKGPPAERYRRMIALAARHGMPRWLFVRVPGEAKPVHLDLAGPLLTDAVVRMLARSGESSGEVRFTEMLPRPPVSHGPVREFRLSCVRGTERETRRKAQG